MRKRLLAGVVGFVGGAALGKAIGTIAASEPTPAEPIAAPDDTDPWLYEPSKPELARYLHEQYEEIAGFTGWETQEGTSVPFAELPRENKETMLMLAQEMLENHVILRVEGDRPSQESATGEIR